MTEFDDFFDTGEKYKQGKPIYGASYPPFNSEVMKEDIIELQRKFGKGSEPNLEKAYLFVPPEAFTLYRIDEIIMKPFEVDKPSTRVMHTYSLPAYTMPSPMYTSWGYSSPAKKVAVETSPLKWWQLAIVILFGVWVFCTLQTLL